MPKGKHDTKIPTLNNWKNLCKQMHLVKKLCIGKVTSFCNYFHNSALMLPVMLPGLCGTKGSLHPKKVIHMVLIAFCRDVRVQCKEKLFQTPASKPGFHVKISNKKAATDVAEAINFLGTFFSGCLLPICCHLLLPNQHCFHLAQWSLPAQNLLP